MKLTQPYEYKILERITDETTGKRVYKVDGSRGLPSVTTILSAMKSKETVEALAKWRKNVGDKEADRVVTLSTSMGTDMHDNLEQYILSEGKAKQKGVMLAKMMTDLIIKEGLSKVDEVWGTEAQLYYPELYAGTTDVAGVWKGKEAIMDFKNSRKLKKEEWIEDYLMQLVAYSLAHNITYGTNIKTGVIMLATHSCEYQEFVLEGKEFEKYTQLWLNKVYDFYKTQP